MRWEHFGEVYSGGVVVDFGHWLIGAVVIVRDGWQSVSIGIGPFSVWADRSK